MAKKKKKKVAKKVTKKTKRKCSLCRKRGHTKRTCSDRAAYPW